MWKRHAKSLTGTATNRKQAFGELAQVVAELRQEAKEKGIDRMSKQEINAAVAWARLDSQKTRKPSAK